MCFSAVFINVKQNQKNFNMYFNYHWNQGEFDWAAFFVFLI